MIKGKWYISTGFRPKCDGGWWHLLIAIHLKWRFAFVKPEHMAFYRRLYIGPIEIEWTTR